jgi:hypothetical protein
VTTKITVFWGPLFYSAAKSSRFLWNNSIYQTTWYHIPEDGNLQTEDIKTSCMHVDITDIATHWKLWKMSAAVINICFHSIAKMERYSTMLKMHMQLCFWMYIFKQI